MLWTNMKFEQNKKVRSRSEFFSSFTRWSCILEMTGAMSARVKDFDPTRDDKEDLKKT